MQQSGVVSFNSVMGRTHYTDTQVIPFSWLPFLCSLHAFSIPKTDSARTNALLFYLKIILTTALKCPYNNEIFFRAEILTEFTNESLTAHPVNWVLESTQPWQDCFIFLVILARMGDILTSGEMILTSTLELPYILALLVEIVF